MKILTCDLLNIDHKIIEEAVNVLLEGGIVAHPTDTCYGLAVDITNSTALGRLYERKGMDAKKPVSILVSSLEEAKKYAEFSKLALRFAREFWPGPLTLVLPRKEKAPDFLNPVSDGIGLRVIKEPVTNALLNAFGGALTTTSANRHGENSPYSVNDISMEPDLIIDVGELRHREKPSTVISICGDKAVTLRQGNLFID